NGSSFTSMDGTLANPGSVASAILANRDSILYVHGYMENTEADNVQIIIRAYLDRGDVNVILLDWGDVTIDINYVYVASQVPAIGKAVAEFLEKLFTFDAIDLNTFHVIGHSLGAHVAGHIGRFLNGTLNRITDFVHDVEELCSHQRSVKIWAEALKNPKSFPGHKCFENIIEYKKDSEEVYFGDATPSNLYGAYCFSTNSHSPFGKGP
ncbi:pancreatic triacylglycerol lipase-like, partial [Ceratina calcarata]|uniref:phospholipase A1 n=1 Tax=Ceratina calcarata TaxID=156304 RepID=A0AAJ7W8D4_9HYME